MEFGRNGYREERIAEAQATEGVDGSQTAFWK
jgi:hypothetical protein